MFPHHFLEEKGSSLQIHRAVGLWLNALNDLYRWAGRAYIYSHEEALQNKPYAI